MKLVLYANAGEVRLGEGGHVSLCSACLARRNLVCKVHKKLKMCFSDLNRKDAWGRVEILGTCPDCNRQGLRSSRSP